MISHTSGTQTRPRVITLSGGLFVVTFQSEGPVTGGKYDKDSNGVNVQAYIASGSAFSEK